MVIIVAGFQVPVMPLNEVVGNNGPVVPEQIAGISAKVGMMPDPTVTDRFVAIAHCPASGVKL